MPCRTATAGAWRRAQRARTTATLHRLPQRVAASGIPLGRARKVASWQARLPSPTITRILYRLCRQGSTAPPVSKNRARRQSRQPQGREARGVGELHGGRGHLPAPRWGFPHPLPHKSMVSVWFAPSNSPSCLSLFTLYAYHLVAERATVPPTPSGAV